MLLVDKIKVLGMLSAKSLDDNPACASARRIVLSGRLNYKLKSHYLPPIYSPINRYEGDYIFD